MATRIEQHADAIMRNVDQFYANAITYEQFHMRQREVWTAIQRAGKRTVMGVTKELRARGAA